MLFKAHCFVNEKIKQTYLLVPFYKAIVSYYQEFNVVLYLINDGQRN